MTTIKIIFLLGFALISSPAPTAVAGEQYHGRGLVTGILNNGQILVVKHEAIPGLMDAMTMPFELSDVSLVKNIKVGDEIRFALMRDGDSLTITALKKTKHPGKHAGADTAHVHARPKATTAPMNMPM